MKIGVLGVGHLGAAIARGYARASLIDQVLLSPRTEENARSLHEEFGFQIASDNEDLVRRSDVIVLAIRPQQVLDTVRMLPWRRGHVVISAAAGIQLGGIRGAVVPASVTRAMPVMASAVNESAIPLYPAEPAAIAALAPLGRIVIAENEESFSALSSLGAWFGWLFVLSDATSEALIGSGVSQRTARKATADMMRAAGAMMSENPTRAPGDILEALATPGGITEAGMKVLEEQEAFDPWRDALSAAVRRLQELADPDGA